MMRTLSNFLVAGVASTLFAAFGCGGGSESAELGTGTTGSSTSTGQGGAGGGATTSTAVGGVGGTVGAGGVGGMGGTTGAGGTGGTTGAGGTGGTTGMGGSGSTTSTTGSGGGAGTTSTTNPITCTWSQDECGPGQYCNAPGCGSGMCVPVGNGASNDKSAVCGCDGATYWNASVASAHAMSLKHDGECGSEEQTSCGGIGGQACAKGLFCNYEGAAAQCSIKNVQGSCWGMPATCSNGGSDSAPAVHTCFGDCASQCDAIKGEVRYYLDKDCGSGGAGGGGGGGAGGGGGGGGTTTSSIVACAWGSDVCGVGQYCNAPGCGKGVCAPIPLKVSSKREPVCGCDGVTYWNETLAKSAGISSRGDGACAAAEATACNDNNPCIKGQSCNLEGSSSICQNLAPKGSCWKLPSACPGGVNDGYQMHACGSDGCASECSLIKAQVRHYADASCLQPF